MLSCSSMFCVVLVCLSFFSVVSCYQVYVYPDSGCRGVPQVFSLTNAACDGVNGFFQIGTCTSNSQSITVKSYSDTKCKTTPPRATVTANVNTCTLDFVKYACIQGQVPTGPGTGGTTTTKPPTTSGTTTSTPTSDSSNPTSDPNINPTITPSLSSSSTSTAVNQSDINTATILTPTTNNVTTLTLTFVIFFVMTILTW